MQLVLVTLFLFLSQRHRQVRLPLFISSVKQSVIISERKLGLILVIFQVVYKLIVFAVLVEWENLLNLIVVECS